MRLLPAHEHTGGTKMEIVTSFQTLMHYAKLLGDARKSGDPEKIRKAKEKHDEYAEMCLKADSMLTGFTSGSLSKQPMAALART
jgi:hypothetical protein